MSWPLCWKKLVNTMDKKLSKKILIGVGAVLFFLGLSYAFVPQVLDGEIVNQGDIQHYVGMSREMTTWNDAHPDDPTQWTGSMFSGMPTTPITIVNGGDATQPVYDFLLLGKRPATYLFIALLGGFLLMLSLGIDWLLAIGGAVAIAFCSYNFQIIEAGHNTKMQAIAFIPWVLAGLIYTYKVALQQISPLASLGRNDNCHLERSREISSASWWARTVLAAALFGLALSLEIKANHVQITYYLALMILLYAVTMIVWVCWKRRSQWKEFLIASALLLVLGGLGIATNANKLLPMNDYKPVSTRGGTELTQSVGGDLSQGGMSLDAMTRYSYGWTELPNLFIPDWNGGGNGARFSLDDTRGVPAWRDAITDSYVGQAMEMGYSYAEADALIRREYGQEIIATARSYTEGLMYWGPQGSTKGPMYMGCITVFLFILGLCLYDGKERWWLLAVTLMAVLLSIGYQVNGQYYYTIQRWASNHLPMYANFRAVSMVLILLQVALPMLGFLVLDRILKRKYEPKRFLRGLAVAFAVAGGFALLSLVIPRSFMAASDANYMDDTLMAAMAADRKALLTADALLCFALIAGVAAVLVGFYLLPENDSWLSRNRRPAAAGAIGLLILLNLFGVGRRYLNDSHFVTPRDFNKAYAERAVDREIKKKDPKKTARVLDMSGDTFNSAIASYHHRCIGGYSPAKLQRYDDLITAYLWGEVRLAANYIGTYDWNSLGYNMPVVSMLNGRYIIQPDGTLAENPYAYGPAWFVQGTVQTGTPDEELYAIGNPEELSLRQYAVLGPDFRGAAPEDLPGEEADTVELLSYAPNELHYRYDAASERIMVFSEIWDKDWKATVDGKPLDLFRADWVLRAAVVPAGRHEIVMRYEPAVYERGRAISRASSIPLLLIVLLAAGACLWLGRKEGRETA